MESIESQLLTLCPDAQSYNLTPDGKVHRFKTDKRDYKVSGWTVTFDNGGQTVTTIGSWNGSIEKTTLFDGKKTQLSPGDKKRIEEKVFTKRRVFESEVKEAQKKASDTYSEKWKKLSKKPSAIFKNSYFEKKQIESYKKYVRFGPTGTIFIPMRDLSGKLWSYQYIALNGSKRFAKNGKSKGVCFELKATSKKHTPWVYFCEGFATGASIHMATKGRVIVCFSSHNLVTVAHEFRRFNKHLDVVICADNDAWKDENPGLDKGREASMKSSGYLIYPEFDEKHKEKEPTDFNDLHCLEGIEAVRKKLEEIPSDFGDKVYCLGVNEGRFFLSSKSYPDILDKPTLTKYEINILSDNSGRIEDEYRMPNGKINYDGLIKDLIDSCKKKGKFNYDRVRGHGVWIDDDRVVVHLGDRLLVDGKESELQDNGLHYIYKACNRRPDLKDPLSREDCDMLTLLCSEIKWTDDDAMLSPGMYLLGALVVSRVCGILPIRPHIWVTGGASTGKSTIMDDFVYPMLGGNENILFPGGSSTEAGIRQDLSHRAMPVVFDEFETKEGGADKRIDSCIELMRLVWKESHARILKGSGSGVSSRFTMNFNAIVSSIQVRLLDEADRGRFTVLELGEHKSDKIHWKSLSNKIKQIDSDFSNRFFARVVNSVSTIKENFKLIKPLILDQGLGTRVGDQYGMLLACYGVIAFDGPLPKDHAEAWAQCLKTDLGQKESSTDPEDCLNQLLTTSLDVEWGGASGRRKMPIIDILEEMHSLGNMVSPDQEKFKIALNSIGLNATINDSVWYLAVWPRHKELNQKVYSMTKWDKIYINQLKRLKGVQSNKRVRIEGIRQYCLLIPFSVFIDQA